MSLILHRINFIYYGLVKLILERVAKLALAFICIFVYLLNALKMALKIMAHKDCRFL